MNRLFFAVAILLAGMAGCEPGGKPNVAPTPTPTPTTVAPKGEDLPGARQHEFRLLWSRRVSHLWISAVAVVYLLTSTVTYC